MESLADSIRAAAAFTPPSQRRPTPRPPAVVARDIMTTDLMLLSPEMTIAQAIERLVKRRVSGAPVVGPKGHLVGILSELDCMKLVASRAFHQEGGAGATIVADLMTQPNYTIEPHTDLYSIVHKFIQFRVRRLPVLAKDQLVGLVSRRDVLRALHELYD